MTDLEREVVLISDQVRSLLELDPASTHLVLTPSYWALPNHDLMRVGVSLLMEEGATVEAL